MKVQSKKDSFFVNTKRDSKKVIQVSDYYNPKRGYESEWQYVIIKGGDIYDVDDEHYDKDLPVISFEEWQSLPDVPKPEYHPKDVAFKPIIGYKLIKPEYMEAVFKITDVTINTFNHNENYRGYHFAKNSIVENQLIDLGVLNLWCEEVYEKESITLKSGVKLSEYDIAEVK